MHPSRLDSWRDRIVEENKSVIDMVTSNLNSFEVYRNTTNDGFTTDGGLVFIGTIDGSISDLGDKIEIVSNSQFVVPQDILSGSVGDFSVTKIDNDIENDSVIITVVRI